MKTCMRLLFEQTTAFLHVALCAGVAPASRLPIVLCDTRLLQPTTYLPSFWCILTKKLCAPLLFLAFATTRLGWLFSLSGQDVLSLVCCSL
jgi:hypothetical protein